VSIERDTNSQQIGSFKSTVIIVLLFLITGLTYVFVVRLTKLKGPSIYDVHMEGIRFRWTHADREWVSSMWTSTQKIRAR